jgi:hypothetical protein
MTGHENSYYRISLPREVAEPLVELGLARWELAGERSAAEAVDLVVGVAASLGPAAGVAVTKAAAAEVARRIVQLVADKWRARHGEQRLTIDLRARPGKTSLTLEIRGEHDADAAQEILRTLADTALSGG